ncbi:ribbon-helix-helix protein, CopG family [bacterium]|nr:ribbon-helix-helix protein, CopG family [candidate division CSSED10-310 bacterium]
MTRTTITIEDALLTILKQRALDERKSLSTLIRELLRKALLTTDGHDEAKLLPERWRTFSAGSPRVDVGDREALFTVMEQQSCDS